MHSVWNTEERMESSQEREGRNGMEAERIEAQRVY